MANPRDIILGLMVSSFGGALCVWLKTPLPWMIGPLVVMAVCNFSGARLASPPLGRELGLLMVVCAIPVLLTQADLRGGDLYLPVVVPFAWAGLLPLFGIAATGGLLLSWLRFPNPWMMGPLIATILATASGLEFSSMSSRLSNVGQVLLGCALGARFSRQFLIDAPRFIAVILSCIVLMIVLSAAMGWGLATVAGIFVPSMILAAAPGGIAEMSITARTLQLGVALVTAAHVTRVLIIVSLTLPVYYLLQRTHRQE